VVPAPHDPDSFIKANGGEAFRQLIENAEGFFDYYLNRLCATNDAATDKGRQAILRGMAEAVHKTGNSVLIDAFAQKTALRLGVSADAVRTEFKKLSRAKPAAANEPDELAPEELAELPRPSAHEFWLLKLIFLNEDLMESCAANVAPEWLQHPVAQQIFSKRIESHRAGAWTSLAAFLDACETPEMQSLVTEAATENRPLPNPQQQFTDVALRLRNQFIDRQLAETMHRMNQPAVDDTERVELLRRQQELRELKRRPMSPVA
jgi:DNA primase